jgi:hypothetical protein
VVVACGLLYYFCGDWTEERQKALEQKSAEASKILTNVKNSANLVEQMTAIQAAAKELDARAVRAGALVVNQGYFYKLEAETGVKLMDVRPGTLLPPGKAAQKTNFVGVPFTISVQGSFKQVMSFLQHLENGTNFCRFKNINFTKVGAATETGAPVTDTMALSITLELLGLP